MKHRVLNLLTALSLLLCVAVGALWVRSYWRFDTVSVERQSGCYSIDSSRGTLRLVDLHFVLFRPSGEQARGWHVALHHDYAFFDYGDLDTVWSVAGISRRRLPIYMEAGDSRPQMILSVLSVPHAFVTVPLAVLPLAAFFSRIRQRRRAALGCCRSCGYDLRATPAKCPECGTTAAGVGS